MSTTYSTELIHQIQKRYSVGTNFAAAYIEHWQSGSEFSLSNLNDIRRLPGPQSVWFDYALSTNQRALESWREIATHLPEGAERYLDIGCAYGGSLVAAAGHGLQVSGIEIDERLIKLGTANCLDHNLKDCIYKADILDSDLPQRLGKFDVITLMSVIEHVLDVPGTLQNCVELLAPGGILFMEIPNKFCTSFVARDPHFHLFGITLLDRPQAIQYHELFFPDEYDVGDYYKLGYYRHVLHRSGCEARLVFSPSYSLLRFLLSPLLFIKLTLSYLRYQCSYKRKLPRNLSHTIDLHFRAYLDKFFRDAIHSGIRLSSDDSFQIKYLYNVWTLVARKPLRESD